MRRSRKMRVRWIFTLITTFAPAAWAQAAPDTDARRVGTDAQQKQWVEGLELVAIGKFDKGARLINEVVSSGVIDRRVTSISKWLTEFEKLEAQRAERRRADYETYASWAKEDARDGKWIRAIAECAQAFNNTDDENAFRKEPWVVDTVTGAIKAAREFEKDGKWYKAARIHIQLQEIFPRNADYREAFLRCQEHIRLELSYTPTSDWETAVADITPEMAKEAFKRIYLHYIKEVSFQKSAEDALEQLLLMTKTPKLAKVFRKLDSKDDVDEFRERIQTWLDRVHKEPNMSWATVTDIFEKVLQINREVDLFPQTVVIREFVQGLLKPLDRFSDMLWPADTDEFNKHTQGTFTGVGISIRKGRGEPIKVITPLEDTPAYEVGVRPGDLITHIDGKPAAPLNINKAVQLITGPPGTTVTLTIKRPGVAKPIEQKLIRAEITIYTVKGYTRGADGQWDYLIDPSNGIGYIRVTNFTERTLQELSAAMKSLTDEHKARGVILDLRGNPGGLLKAAVEATNLFLAGDKEIVSTQDRRGKDMQMFTTEPEGDHYPDIPLIVLVNGSSASASEIVTGGLQVHRRAWVIGERTFGKGSVQQVLPLTAGRQAFLKLTTAWYYLPNGRCLHRDDDSETWGVDPDVKVALVPKEMIKVANLRLRKDILKGRNQDDMTEADYERVFATQPSDREGEPGTAESQDADKFDGEEDEEDEDESDQAPREDPN
ncbi:MAG TPA: S41 family peptidase, partial [Phycisphaerae bacterium]|nr:S41 family peptidase [Phycisphaerae bacterium]